jgi:hypothetical protein
LTYASIVSEFGEGIGTTVNYSNIEKIINYGTTYRRQEIADLLDTTSSWDISDDICAILITVKATMPTHVWHVMLDNLLKFQTNVQIQLIEEEEDENDS